MNPSDEEEEESLPQMAVDVPARSDLEGGLRFMHVIEMQSRTQLEDVAATVYALAEELVAAGALDLRAMQARRDRIRNENAEQAKNRPAVQVAPPGDKYALESPGIDCASLMHLCRGRCCQLTFPLSFQDLDEGVVRWDYSRPYQIRRKEDNYCVHSDADTRGCQVYTQRPAICRTYDCRNDKRVWVDFERRIPADPELVQPSKRR